LSSKAAPPADAHNSAVFVRRAVGGRDVQLLQSNREPLTVSAGWSGGIAQVETFTQMQARIPERIIEKAVKGMLPKGRLGRTLFTHMKVSYISP
jgi:hypothetical protein